MNSRQGSKYELLEGERVYNTLRLINLDKNAPLGKVGQGILLRSAKFWDEFVVACVTLDCYT